MYPPGRRGLTKLIVLAAGLLTACASQSSSVARSPTPVDLNATAEGVGEARSSVDAHRASRGDIPLAEAVRYARIEELLADRAPTLDVISRGYGRFSLRVRGRPALAGSAAPLVVIDGMRFGEGGADMLATIAPRDVRRVEVLRDVGATSAYGARGANGVVLVTLRRGRR